MEHSAFFRCACYLTNNIYIPELDVSVNYLGQDRFRKEYEMLMCSYGYSKVQKDAIIEKVEKQVALRKQEAIRLVKQKELIDRCYIPRNPDVYTLKESYLHPSFLKLVEDASHNKRNSALEILSQEKQVYRFPVFTKSFCDSLIQELDHFERSDMPKIRPSTMNNYGMILSVLGFDKNFLDPLREKYLTPISKMLFPEWTGSGFDSHRAFTVTYEPGKDEGLGFHIDNAEVAFNICLGRKFAGGELYFSDMRTVAMDARTCIMFGQEPTTGFLHRGQQFHGALPTTEGQRVNLMIWLRSSEVRNPLCPMCLRTPRLVAYEGYADGFTMAADASTQKASNI